MNTKLTLTIEKSIIEKAKSYANRKSRSLSDIIENYLKKLTIEEETTKLDTNPLVESLRGSFKISKDSDYKKILQERRENKYL